MFNLCNTHFIKSCIYLTLTFTAFVAISCSNPINTVGDPHFTEDGYSLDSLKENFTAEPPKALGFYIEVSGSMNGYFRSNKATRFKKDVWSIVSKFGGNDVCILSNKGTISEQCSIDNFRTKMNSGKFVSRIRNKRIWGSVTFTDRRLYECV